MDTPFFGGTYTNLSPNLADSACVNLYPEMVETKEGKAIGGFYSTPGLKQWLRVGTGPIRGIKNAWAQNKLIVISGNTVYSIDINGASTTLGTLTTIAGPVSILANADQVFVCDGVAGMVYSGGAWTNTGLVRPQVAVYQDTFGLVNSTGTNKIFQSNVGDLSTWDPLSFTTADSTPSPVIGMAELFRQVWVFKTDVGEIYNDVGSNGFSFARMEGAYIQAGCIAPYSVAAGEHQILWLGQNDKGTSQVYMTNGYQAVPASTHAIDYAISQYNVISDAVAFVYQQGGHEFYVLTFPTAGATWVFDTRLKLWHQRGEWVNGEYLAHDGQCHAQWQGFNLVGSASQGVIYQYALGYGTDDIASAAVNPKRWMRRWRALQKPVSVPMRFPALQIDMQTGIAIPSEQITISGSVPSGTLGYSVDYRYAITSPTGPYTAYISGGSLPPGLSMDSTGHVTGTPTSLGTFSWIVTAYGQNEANGVLSDSCVVVPQERILGAVAHWKLDDSGTTAVDSSGNGFNLTYTGAVTHQYETIAPNGDAAALFGGGCAYAEIPALSTLPIGANGFSVVAWIKHPAIQSGPVECRIAACSIGEYLDTVNLELLIAAQGEGGQTGPNDCPWWTLDGVNYSGLSGGSVIPVDTPVMITGTLSSDGVTQKLYAGTELLATKTIKAFTPSAGTMIIGGSKQFPASYNFNGVISNVILFNKELSISDISVLNTQGAYVTYETFP